MAARGIRTPLIGRLLAIACALATLLVGGVVALPSASAYNPTITYTQPLPGQEFTNGTVTISGTYTSDEPVVGVNVVLCRPSSPTTCQDYLTGVDTGAFAKPWKSLPAAITPDDPADGRTGSYTLTVTNVPTTALRAATYATDRTTAKGPRGLVDFTVVGSPPPPSYISVLWGRGTWKAAAGAGCVNSPDTARTLQQNADDLAAYGLFGVAEIVTNRVAETTHNCTGNYALESSWADLATLRDNYGWVLTSQTRTYPNLTLYKTPDPILAESRDSLPIFAAHGHNRAWGLFAYPNNKQNAFVQNIVTQYFSFGRLYSGVLNSRATTTTFPYTMSTLSVNGGRCNNPALPCYTMPMKNNRRTTSPDFIAKMLNPGPDQCGTVQFYRIVDGQNGQPNQGFNWDCTSADWRDRWTGQPELYCRSTFLEAIARRSPTAIVTDPASVGELWGRVPATPPPAARR